MIISDLFSSKDACPVCGQTPCNCTHIAESVAEANYSDTPLSTYSNNANPELRNIHIPGNMKHPGWKEPTWSFAEVAEKLGLTPKELQQLAFSLGNFPKKAEGVKSSYGSKAYYPRSEIKRWVNASGIRDIIKSRQGVAEGEVVQFKQKNPLTPNLIKQLKALSQQALELFWEGSDMPTAAQGQVAQLGKNEEQRMFKQNEAQFKALGYEYSINEESQDILYLHSIAREAWYNADKPANMYRGLPDLMYNAETNTLSYYDLIGDDGYEYNDNTQFEGVAEGSLKEVSLDLAKRARDKAEYNVDMDYDDMRDRPEGYSEKQRSRFQRYIDKKEPRAKGDRDWDPPKKGVAEQQVNEISPYDFDSDEDYYNALRAAKRKAQGRSADDYDDYEDEPMDNNDDDESYYEKYVRTKGLEEVQDQKPESLTYKDLFKQPDPNKQPEPKDELHLHNWGEYWKLRNEKQPQQQKDVAEGDKKPEPPEADYGDDYQAMVGRLKKLAGMGPLKTVYDPKRRVYRNMPTAVQPPKK